MSEENKNTGTGQAEKQAGTEERKVQSKDLLQTLNNIIREGSARRIIVMRKGRTLLDIPVTAGAVAGAVLAFYLPWIAAITAVGALVGGCTVRIERDEPPAQ